MVQEEVADPRRKGLQRSTSEAPSSSSIGVREKLECQMLRELVVTQLSVIKQTLLDSVPKAVMLSLVKATREAIQAVGTAAWGECGDSVAGIDNASVPDARRRAV